MQNLVNQLKAEAIKQIYRQIDRQIDKHRDKHASSIDLEDFQSIVE